MANLGGSQGDGAAKRNAPDDSLKKAYVVAAFRESDPPTYDGMSPGEDAEDWAFEIEAILQAADFNIDSWVPLAVMTLRRMAATWWRTLGINPWELPWVGFKGLFLKRFAPDEYVPESPDEEADCIRRYNRFNTIVISWGHVADDTMNEYIQRFEMTVLEECPYKMTEEEKCRLLWRGVPIHVRAYARCHYGNYSQLRSEVLRAEKEWLRQRMRVRAKPYGFVPRTTETSPDHHSTTSAIPKEGPSGKDLEEDPEEDSEEVSDEGTA